MTCEEVCNYARLPYIYIHRLEYTLNHAYTFTSYTLRENKLLIINPCSKHDTLAITFSPIFENTTFSSNFDEKVIFGYFKSQISKWKHMRELLNMARGFKDSCSLSNKQKKNVSSHGSPCRSCKTKPNHSKPNKILWYH